MAVTLNTLESHLWDSANILCGPVDATDFKTRGEWISSMKLDGRDIVKDHALKILQENMLNIGESAIELSKAGMFPAADLEELIIFL